MFLADEHAVVAPAIEGDAFVADLADAVEALPRRRGRVHRRRGDARARRPRERAGGRGALAPAARRRSSTCLDKWRFARVAGLAGVPIAPTALGDPDGEMLTAGAPDPRPVDREAPLRARFARRVRRRRARRARLGVPPDAGADRADPRSRAASSPSTSSPTARAASSARCPAGDSRPRPASARRAGRSRTTASSTSPAARWRRSACEGAANLQGFVTDDGDVAVIEVNPRFSGGLPLSLAAGADLVGEFVRGTLGEQIRPRTAAVPARRHDDPPLLRDHRG